MSNMLKQHNKNKEIKITMLRDMENFYLQKLSEYTLKSIPKLLESVRVYNKVLTLNTTPNNLKSVLLYLQNHSLFMCKQLQEITCIDRPDKTLRFNVVYTLYSVKYNTQVLVTVQLPIDSQLPSATQIFEGANWLEREVLDLFGIFFVGHPDQRRILTDYGFQGYPLRKDFPLSGFVEIYYNDSNKRIVYEPVELAQETRIWWVSTRSATK
jgi:NADH dehydrogenase (ubiquinone) Fe-S protein 3